MQTLWQDLRYGVRMLMKAPTVTLTAVITLALGIGANTAIFSVIDAALLKPLPFTESDRLFIIQETRGGDGCCLSYPNFLDMRAQSSALETVAIFNSILVTMTGDWLCCSPA
ncbi:MAG TPA: hypothetical protein VJ810_11210 [Blastocatellia bacterium]|nr:hypothetical protein [Blastocatellia bacterium]